MVRSGMLAMLVVVGVGLHAPVHAKDEPKAAPSADAAAPQKIDVTSTKTESAATIDFRAKLGLSFNSLTTLGVRIEQARDAGDPVGLASVAKELSAAETVSGKKAAVTSDELTKEAVELATLRGSSTELAAVALIVGGDSAKDLDKLAAKAKKREADAKAAAKEGAGTRGIFRQLVVYNQSEVHVHVYVNGRFVGPVEPYDHAHFRMHVHGEVVIDAKGPGHKWHGHVHGDYQTYTLTLND